MAKSSRLACNLQIHKIMDNLLSAEKIKAIIPSELWKCIPALHIVNVIDSTNSYVLRHSNKVKSGFTCLAEQQTAGRGRLDRPWISPYASHIYLSMLWQFTNIACNRSVDAGSATTPLTGLSLAIGVALVNVLKQLGIEKNLGLKWPNDVYWQGNKLAGVLVETNSTSSAAEHPPTLINAVVGLGLNVKMPDNEGTTISQPWTDLHQILGKAPDRNLITGLIITELLQILPRFAEQGLAGFLAEWQAADIYYGRPLMVQTPNVRYSGIGQGINTTGELLLRGEDGVIRSFPSAEIFPRET